jgi:myo-inositol-1(or 4)-monophosphatase
MNTTLKFAAHLAKIAGDEILKYYRSQGVEVKLKSDQTLVTQADKNADRLIRSSLREKFPKDGILSEEDNTIYPAGKPYVWVIDPLDGTTNFSLGLHYWGISIARLKDGWPDLAVLYFPMLDEIYTAAKNDGAFLNSTRLEIKNSFPDTPNAFFSCCSRTHRYYRVNIRYKPRILGSAAYGLCLVARGSAILSFEVTPKVWDFSGSWLVIQEAGGVINPLDGISPYPLIPHTDYGSKKYPMLAAGTKKTWDNGRSRIQPK